MSSNGAAVLVLVIPICIVTGFYVTLFGLANTVSIFRDEWLFIIIQIVFLSIPFVVIALAGAKRISVWMFVTVTSIAVCVWFATRVFSSADKGAGVDFGAVFLMLGAPLAISLAGVVLDRLTRSAK